MKKYAALTLLICSLTAFSSAQHLKSKIDSIYTFHPHQLSKEETEKKSGILDQFWNLVKSDTTMYLKDLRTELRSEGHKSFFYYDGGALLMSLSKSGSDLRLAAAVLPKCDLKDINPQDYVSTLNHMASEKIDITNSALKILEDTSFYFFVPQHSLTFDQGYCLMYCLLPLEPGVYMDRLITAFRQAKIKQAQISVITTIWHANSCIGDGFLESLNAKNTLAKDVAEYAGRMMGNTTIPKESKDYVKSVKQEDLVELKKAALRRYSDEAIDELSLATIIWRRKFACR
jgi:hypothetical protein